MYWAFQAYLGTDSITGKSVRVSRRRGPDGRLFRTKKDAVGEVKRLEEEFDESNARALLRVVEDKKDKTFEYVADKWLNKRYRETVKDSTYLNTSNVFFKLHIIPALGDYKINRIDKLILEGIIRTWTDEFIKHRYNLVVNYTKRVFKYALQEGYIDSNPFDLVHIPIKRDANNTNNQSDGQFYDRDEVIEFLDECESYGENGDFWYTFFRFMIFTGVRSGEIRALRWEDINLDKGLVYISKTLSVRLNEETDKTEMYLSGSTKNNEDRTITLDRITIEHLQKLKEGKKEKELVFPALRNSESYMHGQAASNAMRNIIRKGKLKEIKMHELRHTHCSLLFDAGVNIKEVQKRLGHKDVKITLNIYTHVTKDRQNEVADKLMEYVNKT